jgi:hypothetical protein
MGPSLQGSDAFRRDDMHAFHRLSTGAAVLAGMCGGCAPGGEADPIEGAAGAETVQNGTELNGVSFNGVDLNGVTLEPLRLDEVRLHGRPLAVSLEGASLTGVLPGGQRVSGRALVGAEVAGTLSSGAPVVLHVDSVVAGPERDVELYGISMRSPGSVASRPLCGAPGALAMPLPGSWDESAGTPTGGSHVADPAVFTFACEGYALAKCVLFGYAPWRSVTECEPSGACASRPLSAFHEACTRMLRADYCGDGTPTTRNGTRVDLWDAFGIQADDQPSWRLEAEWSERGAACVDATRWATIEGTGLGVQAYIQAHCPSRWQAQGCGGPSSTFYTAQGFGAPIDGRALIRTRIERPQ